MVNNLRRLKRDWSTIGAGSNMIGQKICAGTKRRDWPIPGGNVLLGVDAAAKVEGQRAVLLADAVHRSHDVIAAVRLAGILKQLKFDTYVSLRVKIR